MPAIGSVTMIGMVMLFSLSFSFSLSQVYGQYLPSCPTGYQRDTDGSCIPIGITQSCPVGYQRSAYGVCVPVSSIMRCPDGHQTVPPGICAPIRSSQVIDPNGSSIMTAISSSDGNLTLSNLSSFVKGLDNSTKQNLTDSSVLVNDSNKTRINQTQTQTQTQKAESPNTQKQPFSDMQQLPEKQQQQSQTQLYPYTLPPVQQQQPFVQPQPFNPVPLSPPSSFSMPMPSSPSYSLPPQTFVQPEIPPRILSDNNYVASTGTLHIVGEVINESYEPMRFVKVTATFYDANNSVIGTDFAYTDPSTLQPGQRAPFDMIVLKGSMPLYLVSHYTLSVDYSDYNWLR